MNICSLHTTLSLSRADCHSKSQTLKLKFKNKPQNTNGEGPVNSAFNTPRPDNALQSCFLTH